MISPLGSSAGGGELWVISPGEEEFSAGNLRTWTSRGHGLEIPAIPLIFPMARVTGSSP